MTAIILSISTLLGLIVGSFLNVVVLRLNTGRSLSGRSACLCCNHELSYLDLVPVLSYVLASGRCRHCGSSISIQYILVEILTAALFLLAALNMAVSVYSLSDIALLALQFAVISLLVVIASYDIRHTIIPDIPVYSLIALAFFLLFVGGSGLVTPSSLSLIAGPLVAAPLFLLWLLSKGKWMGLGDAKLALALGWLLGLFGGITMLLFSFWIGAVVGIALLYVPRLVHEWRLFGWTKTLTMKSEVAFGPFLIASYFLVWFTGFDITSFILF